ncbi:hypothetical protein BJ944DRAFT_236413 [Cunninghamella echinulata]|nr:hypothetical protein BJ944DRAFT_236413 [Cunninghamella echinulata]
MLIKEYRVINNCTLSEYQVAQLYTTAMASKETTGGGEGVEVVKNEPYEKENGEKGQYTYKVFHLASRVPYYVRAVIPESALVIYEEAWNAYPYCKTVLTNGYMKENFSITYETLHVDGSRGEINNALNISDQDLSKREVITIDVSNDPIDAAEYKPEEDPKFCHSFKADRGPLVGPDWVEKCEPVMTCYKLVYIEFKWFGLQTKVESYLAGAIRGMFTKFHRQLFCWMDKWYGLTMDDIRKLEEETKKDLLARRNQTNSQTASSSSSSSLNIKDNGSISKQSSSSSFVSAE